MRCDIIVGREDQMRVGHRGIIILALGMRPGYSDTSMLRVIPFMHYV